MSRTGRPRPRELFEVGRQVVTAAFDGGQGVSDAGLLPIAQLDRELKFAAAETVPRHVAKLHSLWQEQRLFVLHPLLGDAKRMPPARQPGAQYGLIANETIIPTHPVSVKKVGAAGFLLGP